MLTKNMLTKSMLTDNTLTKNTLTKNTLTKIRLHKNAHKNTLSLCVVIPHNGDTPPQNQQISTSWPGGFQ